MEMLTVATEVFLNNAAQLTYTRSIVARTAEKILYFFFYIMTISL